MKYRLLHKDIPVVELTLDEATCTIVKISSVYSPAHLPVGILMKNDEVDRTALNEWWENRAIPASRQGIRDALQELKLSSARNLLIKSFALSLSDHYWVCPANANPRWKDNNFFENPFSEDVGNIILGKGKNVEKISLISPDNTTDGWLRKKWTIINGKRYLMKGGSGATQQEPYN